MILFAILPILIAFIALRILVYFHKKNNKTQKTIFYSGFFYCVLALPFLINPFTWLFGLFFMGVGILYLGLVYLNIPKIFQVYITPIPVFLCIMFLLVESPSKNRFLIPDGYKGRLLVVHGCKDGKEPEWEGWFWRLYRFDSEGTLFTQNSFSGNSFDFLNSEFFYEDEFGNRNRLDYLDNENQFSDSDNKKLGMVYVYGLWSLPHPQSWKIDTPFDFIVDDVYSNPNRYDLENVEVWLDRLRTCGEPDSDSRTGL